MNKKINKKGTDVIFWIILVVILGVILFLFLAKVLSLSGSLK
jgi:hypothetical protein